MSLSFPLPPGTWDSHMHMTSSTHPTTALNLTTANVVIVQPSIYGTDNTVTLTALQSLGPKRARAVVSIDPQTIQPATLQQWHDLGVRGVRVNLVSVSRDPDVAELQRELQAYTDVIRPLGWVLQLYVPMALIGMLEGFVDELGVKVCFDHFGSLALGVYDAKKPVDPYALPGFEALVRLLGRGRTWVKISAWYRVTKDPEMRNLAPVGRELMKLAPGRVVWASDWPHTRFESVVVVPFVEMCYRWCDGEDFREKFFRTNVKDLWDVKAS